MNMAQNKLSKRNLYSFAVSNIGRDLACQGLFTGQLLNYVYFTKNLDSAQFAALTIIMAAARIFDAFNDLAMGNIIDATRSKWGKFKPWIFAGMIGSGIVIIAEFSNKLQGWNYVIFFGFMYFLYSIVFTMNDISYWGMVPSLARNADDRNKLSSLTALCANVGIGIGGIIVPILTTGALAINGSAIYGYMLTSFVFVALFFVLQSTTLIGVKENRNEDYYGKGEKVSIKGIVQLFKDNDQLRWIAVVFFLSQLVPGAAYTMYIYFQFGYNGALLTLFYVFSSVATVVINMFYPQIAKKFTRKQLLKFAMWAQIIGNVLVLLVGMFVPKGVGAFVIPVFGAEVTLQFILMACAYFFCGWAGTSFYMILMICIANTTEYNQYKTGKRNEGIISSTRAFLVKLGSALVTLSMTLFYIIIGVNGETNKIADYEQMASMGTITGDEKLAGINQIIANIPDEKTFAILLFATIVPCILYVAGYLIFSKKYIISEEYFEEISTALKNQRSSQNEEA